MNKVVVYMNNRLLLSHKKNEVLLFGTTWTDLEGIMLSEIRQKDQYYMLPLTCSISKYNKLVNIRRNRLTDIKNKPVAMRGTQQ